MTNPGPVAVAVSLVDDNATADPSDDVVPTLLSGDTDLDDLLDPGEVWLYEWTITAVAGVHTNVATVRATDGVRTVVDTDPATYVGIGVGVVPVVDVEKAVNAAVPAAPTAAEDADSVSVAPRLLVGDPVRFTYLVTNPGPVAVSVALVDDNATADPSDDVSPTLLSGDTDGDGLLDPGEVWLYEWTTTAVAGLHTNLATVTGTDPETGATATDTDPATYVASRPGVGAIVVEKAVNAVDPWVPKASEDADVVPVVLAAGTPVVWTYLVVNTGGTDLTGVVVTDDAGTADPGDDFVPRYVAGDDADGILQPGEVWLFTSEGVVAATATSGYCNVATVSGGDAVGVVSDADGNCHTVRTPPPVPVVDVEKAVNAAVPTAPTPAEDADAVPVPVAVGSVVVWTYLVTNPGPVAVSVSLVDDNATADPADDVMPSYVSGDTDGDDLLDPGEVWLYEWSATAVEGVHTNVATITGTDPDTGATAADTDPASYVGIGDPEGGIDLTKFVNGEDANSLTTAVQVVLTGGSAQVTYAFRIANLTATPLTDVTLVDDNGTPGDPGDDFQPTFTGGDANGNGVLDPGEVWTYTVVGSIGPGYTVNTARVTATAAGAGVSDTDIAVVLGVDPSISVVKAVNALDPWNPTDAEDANDGTGPTLEVGSTVVFTYLVTNDGNVGLTLGSIVDDNGTPDDPTDDVMPVYVSGDVGNPGVLDPGETWLFTISGTIVADGVVVLDGGTTVVATQQLPAPQTGSGANTSGPYDPSGTGEPSANGNGDGLATGRPDAGTVGTADTKNPPGQVAKYTESPDSGYECDDNLGVAKGNPAHTGCERGGGTYVNTVTVVAAWRLPDGTLVTVVATDTAALTTP